MVVAYISGWMSALAPDVRTPREADGAIDAGPTTRAADRRIVDAGSPSMKEELR
jgi:hypothetical protein